MSFPQLAVVIENKIYGQFLNFMLTSVYTYDILFMEVMPIGTQDFNRRSYDQRLIRFPKGTIKKFHELFTDDVSFNGWVVRLVVSRLVMYDEHNPKKPPKM